MKRALLIAVLAVALLQPAAQAATLAEATKQSPPKIFRATKGAVMSNAIDQTNNLEEGDKALLLSGLDLTDITGISTLIVEDAGKVVPVGSVQRLHVFLNRNRITTVPDEIGALDNVEFLYFEHNQIARLPHALAEMDMLEGMYFTDNRFAEIPAFLLGMTRLKKLQFSENQITVLPPEIGNLVELRHFNMAKNRIAVIPESISRFSKLRVCDLSHNPFTSMPEAFGQVQIVNQLRVQHCPISTLPPELRAKISTEKPPGSKPPDKIIVHQPDKPAKKDKKP